MKRFISILIILLFLCVECFASQQSMLGGLARKRAGGSSPSYPSGTWTYAYTGDYPDDTDAAWDNAKAKLNGTAQDVASVTTDYLYIAKNAFGDDYLKHTISSSELVTAGATIWCSVYIDDDEDGNLENTQVYEIGDASWDANNFLSMFVAGDGSGNGKFTGGHKGNGTSDNISTAVDSVAVDTWYRVGFSWKESEAGNNESIICIACRGGGTQADCSGKGTWTGAAIADNDLVSINNQPDTIYFGELNTGTTLNDGLRVADVFIVTGFQSTDPF